ncbi:MAG: hypothetical protein IPK83_22100 [Planctomycetes bacterium]|nr:hypothetical protein [Planctomycetota bacterium]
MEASYDGKSETNKVAIYSKAYFELLKEYEDLGECLAQSERVIVKCGSKWVETTPSTDVKSDSKKD